MRLAYHLLLSLCLLAFCGCPEEDDDSADDDTGDDDTGDDDTGDDDSGDDDTGDDDTDDCTGWEDVAADGLWEVYEALNVKEDDNTWMPTLKDFPTTLIGTTKDAEDLYDVNACSYCLIGLSTHVLVDEASRSWDLSIHGDDCVGIWVDGAFVAGRPNAEDPAAKGSVELTCGWHHVQVQVFNGAAVGGVDLSPAAGTVADRVASSVN